MKAVAAIALIMLSFVSQAGAAAGDLAVSTPAVKNLSGDELSVAAAGSQVDLALTLKNGSLRDYAVTTVIEIRDSQQYTAYLQLHADNVARISEKKIRFSWNPQERGEYEIRSFALAGPDSQVLSPIAVTKVIVGDKEITKQLAPVAGDGPASELELYVLQKINDDRTAAGLAPVSLSRNAAAQAHAEEILKTRQISHWLTDGEKPYMAYSKHGGQGAVSQNVATSGYSEDYDGCASGIYICSKTEPYYEIDRAEYLMLYDDKECCNDGHRDNILDKYHTHVNIGVAYDDYFFAIVQNFENQYVVWTDPIAGSGSDVSMAGFFAVNRDADSKNDLGLFAVTVSYDEPPTRATYEANSDRNGYGEGELIAVVAPPAPPGSFYEKPAAGYDIVEAKSWAENATNFSIDFTLQGLVDAHGSGVYTVAVWAKDAGGQRFVAAETSIVE